MGGEFRFKANKKINQRVRTIRGSKTKFMDINQIFKKKAGKMLAMDLNSYVVTDK